MIDSEGYRANVGMIVVNGKGDVLWAKRTQGTDSWQFPQGGIDKGESPEDALYRELYEEVGLRPNDVSIINKTPTWLYYKIPEVYIRKHQKPLCIGQKQRWFLLQLKCDESTIHFGSTSKPEFSEWKWVSYWYPLTQIVHFKRAVYFSALKYLSSGHTALVRRKSKKNNKRQYEQKPC